MGQAGLPTQTFPLSVPSTSLVLPDNPSKIFTHLVPLPHQSKCPLKMSRPLPISQDGHPGCVVLVAAVLMQDHCVWYYEDQPPFVLSIVGARGAMAVQGGLDPLWYLPVQFGEERISFWHKYKPSQARSSHVS